MPIDTLTRRRASIAVALTMMLCGSTLTIGAAPDKPYSYPKARKGDVVDNYHGTKVADPYRWLEDADSAETGKWVEAQNKLTFAHLGKIKDRDRIKKRLTELWNYEKYGMPTKRGDRYFYSKNDGLQNQSVVYVSKTLQGTPRVLLDPNKLSKEGTVALSGRAISEDGKLMAYGLATAGSDWQEWRVRDVETGKDFPEHIRWVKFSGASWSKDGKGFYYSRYDQPNEATKLQDTNYYQKLFYHRVGTSQAEDELIYQRKDHKDWGFGGLATDDGRYLIIHVSKGTLRKNMLFYKDLQDPKGEFVELIDKFEAEYSFIDNDGPVFWIRTDLEAPNGKVIAIDTRHPERTAWKDIIPEWNSKLNSIDVVGDQFFGLYLFNVVTRVRKYSLDGTFAGGLRLPGQGTVRGFRGKRTDKETFYSFQNYLQPSAIYLYELDSQRSTVFRRPKVDFRPRDYKTLQVVYTSKDGTRMFMFVNYKNGMRLDSKNPTLLYGYGGFNISLTPTFSVTNLVWMEMGGIYAVANIRGGGEFGRDWHEAGMKLEKQNVFDDFIAAAEHLIGDYYTSTPKLAIRGGSNGGLLVGACMTQRPELFGCCLPAVGVMDMLRFHKFTIGWAWTSDYGSSENPDEFKALYAYSPLHNIEAGTAYPPTLITTADHDDRVVPLHSFKFAATLQAAQSGPAPTLIRIQTKAGHGAGKPTTMRIEEAADILSFLVDSLDVDIEKGLKMTPVDAEGGGRGPAGGGR